MARPWPAKRVDFGCALKPWEWSPDWIERDLERKKNDWERKRAKGKVKGKFPESRRVAKKPECESDLFRRWHDAFRRASGRNARDRAGKVVFGEENFA
jgi:hypothetical protein